MPRPAAPVVTEDDIAHFLASTPAFFERHAELLASVRLASPHGERAISLQQRQVELLRRQIAGFERDCAEMVRNARANGAISDQLMSWAAALLRERDLRELPAQVAAGLRERFGLEQVELRLWGLADDFAGLDGGSALSPAERDFAAALSLPRCAAAADQPVLAWLAEPALAQSIALVPLCAQGAPFGLLLLASHDPQRFCDALATDLLQQLGALASAALSRLLPAGARQ